MPCVPWTPLLFFFNDTATTEIYTLSLHDALPISSSARTVTVPEVPATLGEGKPLTAKVTAAPGLTTIDPDDAPVRDRKSTRLNSSHQIISYAVFCLKKKRNDTARVYAAALGQRKC